MSKCKLSVYKNQEVLKLIDQILPYPHSINSYYKFNNCYVYENQKGYIHVLSFIKQGKYISILDQLLTDKNILTEVSRYGNYNTIQEAINSIEGSENYEM